jgi:hypothetical protein
MARERAEGENPKRCQATAVQETRIRNLTRSREGAKIFGIGKLWETFFFLGWAAWLFA